MSLLISEKWTSVFDEFPRSKDLIQVKNATGQHGVTYGKYLKNCYRKTDTGIIVLAEKYVVLIDRYDHNRCKLTNAFLWRKVFPEIL